MWNPKDARKSKLQNPESFGFWSLEFGWPWQDPRRRSCNKLRTSVDKSWWLASTSLPKTVGRGAPSGSFETASCKSTSAQCVAQIGIQWKQQKQDSKSFLHTSININWKLSKNIERRNITCSKLIIKTSKSFHFFSQAALRGPDNHCHMSWNYDITSGNTDIWQAQISTISWEAEDHKQDLQKIPMFSTKRLRISQDTLLLLWTTCSTNVPFCCTFLTHPSATPFSKNRLFSHSLRHWKKIPVSSIPLIHLSGSPSTFNNLTSIHLWHLLMHSSANTLVLYLLHRFLHFPL